MRPCNFLERCFFLITLLSVVPPFVHGRYIAPREGNPTDADESASQNDTPFVPTRGHYDMAVTEWKISNPHLVDKIETEAIEALWNHLTRNSTSSGLKRSSPDNSPVYKRQDAPQSDLDAARKLVTAVVAEVEQQNGYLKTNPHRNQHTPQPTNSSSSNMRTRNYASFPAVNETVRRAAAMVAEADAADLASKGTLFKDYTFTGKYAKFNKPGFPTGSRLKKRDTYYWLEDIASEFPGNFPFGDDDGYYVFRNVQDAPFNAKGDGVTDDTAAINAAIAYGNRCGNDCGSSSVKGALVYFPAGTYLVSSPIISLYNTQLVGNTNSFPVILAAPQFAGLGVITSDVYTGGTDEYYVDTVRATSLS